MGKINKNRRKSRDPSVSSCIGGDKKCEPPKGGPADKGTKGQAAKGAKGSAASTIPKTGKGSGRRKPPISKPGQKNRHANAFVLYYMERLKKNKGRKSKEIMQKAGRCWKKMSPEAKSQWYKRYCARCKSCRSCKPKKGKKCKPKK